MEAKTAVKVEESKLILPSSSELLAEKINKEKIGIAKANQSLHERFYYEAIERLARRWFGLNSLDSLSRSELNILVTGVTKKAKRIFLIWGGTNALLVFLITTSLFIIPGGTILENVGSLLIFMIFLAFLNVLFLFCDGSDGIINYPPRTLPTIIEILLYDPQEA